MEIDLTGAEWDMSPTPSTNWTITIWPTGLVNFSADATARYCLVAEGRRLQIGYVSTKKMLLFRIVDDENTQGVVKIAKRQKGAVVSVRGTLDKFGVPYGKPSMRYPLVFDEENKILAADLTKGVPVSKTRAE